MTKEIIQQGRNDEIQLEFKVGPLRFCVPAFEVEAIITPPKMVHVPLGADVVASCFNHQGRTVTVISLHNKFGLPFTLNENKTHIILATVDDDLKGFWVDQAIDITPLNAFETSADYFPAKDKAYSNFLLRDKDIILQTDFDRLHKCEKSNLNWIAALGTKEPELNAEQAASDTEVEEVVEINKPEDKAEAIGPVVSLQKPESVNTVHIVVDTRPAAKINIADSHARKNNPVQPVRIEKKADADKNNRPVVASRPSPALRSPQNYAYTDSYNEAASETTNKINDKNNGLLILVAGLMLLVVLGVAGMYLFDTGSGAESRNIKQVAKVRDVYKAQTTAAALPSAKEPVVTSAVVKDVPDQKGSEAPEVALSENASMNEVAQPGELMPEKLKAARVFELHVNESSDTDTSSSHYAITSFESATNKQESVPDTQQYTHIVVKGDTLWHITRRYLENPNRYPELAAASHIKNPHRIYPGDVIKIIVNQAKKSN